jgi:hypothetical protein
MQHGFKVLGYVVIGLIVVVAAHQVWAYPDVALKSERACETCHVNVAGGPELTDAGKAYKSDGKVPAADDLESPAFLGVDKCKMCHMAQFKSWAETKHATAMATLEGADAEVTAAMAKKLGIEVEGAANEADGCLTCHVTGLKLEGGYPQADAKKTAPVSNVSCEACHGPGGVHMKAAKAEKKATINDNVTEVMCKGCHTPVMSPDFDFAEYSKTGIHTTK